MSSAPFTAALRSPEPLHGGIIDELIPPAEFDYSNSKQRELREVAARAIRAAKRATQRATQVTEKLEG